MLHYDYCIIGGGMSGLYLALQLEKKYPHARILLLEKENRLGGRTIMRDFHGRLVVTGAGIGRYGKDSLLQSLQQEVATKQGETPVITTRICYQFENPVSTLSFISKLKEQKAWIDKHRHHTTFRECFLSFFSPQEYEAFCASNGYTDFEHADIVDTLYDYGFEDNVPGAKIFYVQWNRIIRHLRKQLQRTTIRLRTTFETYENISPHVHHTTCFRILTSQRVYQSRNICFAGSIEKYPFPLVKKQIGYNSFLRMYALLDTRDPLHKGTTYLSNIRQKQVVLTPRIHMISYSDNDKADAVMKASDEEVAQLAGCAIKDSVRYYWKQGTHYYHPLDPSFRDRSDFIRYAQHPEAGVFLVGEVISKNQGWTEGALQSVHRILPLL